jgi:hypothetical protein
LNQGNKHQTVPLPCLSSSFHFLIPFCGEGIWVKGFSKHSHTSSIETINTPGVRSEDIKMTLFDKTYLKLAPSKKAMPCKTMQKGKTRSW